jgi:hypothetical protein
LQVLDVTSQLAALFSQVHAVSAPENISQTFHLAQRMKEIVRRSAIGQLTYFQT